MSNEGNKDGAGGTGDNGQGGGGGTGDNGQGGAGGGGNQQPAFKLADVYATLSPENKEFATRRGYIKADGTLADVNMFLDGHRGAEKLLGGEKLPVPNLADENERAQWPGWKKLGTPDDAKGYQFKRPEMPKGPDGQPLPYDEAAENSFRELAAKLRMPQYMFDAIMTDEVGRRLGAITGAGTQMAAEKTRIETALRKDLGAGYDTSMKQANAALVHMAKVSGVDPGKLADMASHEFGSEETARLFLKIASMLGDDTLQGGKDSGFATGPAAARAELERLDTDTGFQTAYKDKDHPDHQKAIERRLNLLRIANGG